MVGVSSATLAPKVGTTRTLVTHLVLIITVLSCSILDDSLLKYYPKQM
jgi:hypothetical protein